MLLESPAELGVGEGAEEGLVEARLIARPELGRRLVPGRAGDADPPPGRAPVRHPVLAGRGDRGPRVHDREPGGAASLEQGGAPANELSGGRVQPPRRQVVVLQVDEKEDALHRGGGRRLGLGRLETPPGPAGRPARRTPRPDRLASRLGQVVGPEAGPPRRRERALDRIRLRGEREALSQHRRRRQDLRPGVGAIGAREVVGGAVIGLVDGGQPGVEARPEAEPARAQEQAAGIREHIAEEVRGDDDVVGRGIADQPVDRIVDVVDPELDAGAVGGLLGHGHPQPADRWHSPSLDHHRQTTAGARGRARPRSP